MNSHRTPNILVVGDAAVGVALCAYLAQFRFATCAASDVPAVQDRLDAGEIDLVVLDLNLRGVNGLALTRELRATSSTPVILLGATGCAADRIVGLEMGADDYLDGPWERRELVARIQTVLRRTAGEGRCVQDGDVIRFDGWELRRSERSLNSPAGQPVALSNAEFQLLLTFLQTPRRVVSRDCLMALARGRKADSLGRSIDLLVSRLRHKLGAHAGAAALIRTVRGAGYLFDVQTVRPADEPALRRSPHPSASPITPATMQAAPSSRSQRSPSPSNWPPSSAANSIETSRAGATWLSGASVTAYSTIT